MSHSHLVLSSLLEFITAIRRFFYTKLFIYFISPAAPHRGSVLDSEHATGCELTEKHRRLFAAFE